MTVSINVTQHKQYLPLTKDSLATWLIRLRKDDTAYDIQHKGHSIMTLSITIHSINYIEQNDIQHIDTQHKLH